MKTTNNTKHFISPKYLSREDAAVYAGVSTDTIDRWATDGKIVKIKDTKKAPNSKVLFPIASIDAYLESLISKITGGSK